MEFCQPNEGSKSRYQSRVQQYRQQPYCNHSMYKNKIFSVLVCLLLYSDIIIWIVLESTWYFGELHCQTKQCNKNLLDARLGFAFFTLFLAFSHFYFLAVAYNENYNLYKEEDITEFINKVINQNPVVGMKVLEWKDDAYDTVQQETIKFDSCTNISPPIPDFSTQGKLIRLRVSITLQFGKDFETKCQKVKERLQAEHPNFYVTPSASLVNITASSFSIQGTFGFINGDRPFWMNKRLRNVLYLIGIGGILDIFIEFQIVRNSYSVIKELK